jgi:hypothetical protein
MATMLRVDEMRRVRFEALEEKKKKKNDGTSGDEE